MPLDKVDWVAATASGVELDQIRSESRLIPSVAISSDRRRAPTANMSRNSPNNFDFLRLAAALAVLLSHQFALQGLPEPLTAIGSWGGIGVLMFFAISGYLVAGSWQRDPHAGRFLWRRALRLWPGLLVAAGLTTFVLGPFVSALAWSDYFMNEATWRYLRLLGLWEFHSDLPGVFTGNAHPGSINGSLWTLPLEVRCYVLLALLGGLGLLGRRGLAWVLCAAFLGWFFFVWTVGYEDMLRMKVQMGVVFTAGAALQRCETWWKARWHRLPSALALLIALCLSRGWLDMMVTLGLTMTVVWLGTLSTPVLRQCGRFGDFSYGLYIYAFPMQQLFFWLGGSRLPHTLGSLGVIGCTLVLAALSWHLIEAPSLRLKPRAPRTA